MECMKEEIKEKTENMYSENVILYTTFSFLWYVSFVVLVAEFKNKINEF